MILMLPMVLMICLSDDLGDGVVLGDHDDDVGNVVGDDVDDGVCGHIDDLCGDHGGTDVGGDDGVAHCC